MEANRQSSQGIKEEDFDPNSKLTLEKDNQDWVNLRYKIVRSRWKKVKIRQDRAASPMLVDKIIKETPVNFLTSRPPDTSLDIKTSTVSIEIKSKPVVDNKDSPKRVSVASLNPGTLGKLRENVLKVVSAMKLKQAGDERVARISQNAERSVSNANYTLASPEREKKPEMRTRVRRGSRRLSSGSVISYQSRASSYADLKDEFAKKSTKKIIKAMPARTQKPEQDKSKGEREESLSSSSSPSKRSDGSGFHMIYENTPKVIVLNQTFDNGKQINNVKYTRDGEGLLRKLKAKGTKIDLQTELLENSEYRHVVSSN